MQKGGIIHVCFEIKRTPYTSGSLATSLDNRVFVNHLQQSLYNFYVVLRSGYVRLELGNFYNIIISY